MSNADPVYSILERHLPSVMLDGYMSGIIDDDKGRLYAFTLNSIVPEEYEKYSYLHASLGGHGIWGADQERMRIYTDDGTCYHHKEVSQCIQEGLYHAFSIKFFGCYYEGCWYILKELSYYGEHVSIEQAREMLSQRINDDSILSSDIYLPIKPHFPYTGQDSTGLSGSVEFMEFVGLPELVAYVQQEEKQALCRAFAHFMNLDVVIPFMNRLKAARFEEFSSILPLYSDDFTLIFPKSRAFILIPAFVKDAHNAHSIYYFCWHASDRKMYQWTYFRSRTYDFSFHYSPNIIDDLSTICYWNDISYLHSSCTLDDDHFWNTYVLLKEGDAFKYLAEITI